MISLGCLSTEGRKIVFALFFMGVGCSLLSEFATAQQSGSTSGQGKKESDPLLDDLLDLLDEDESEETPEPATQKKKRGEQAASHPLQAIQLAMLTIADALRRGKADNDTQGLQQEVENQLEELIEQMEKPSNDSSDSSQNEEQSSSSDESSTKQDSSSQSQQQANSQEQQEERSPNNDGSESDRPGERGDQADGRVELNQVTKLQQDVWGSLPKQVRQKMQSRMVESFLPRYRKQIEAYYRALLKEK